MIASHLQIPLTQAGIRIAQEDPGHPHLTWWYSRISESLREQARREAPRLRELDPPQEPARGAWAAPLS